MKHEWAGEDLEAFSIDMLPADQAQAILVGRVLRDAGPSPVLVRDGAVIDVSASAPTVADLLELGDIADLGGETLCDVRDINTAAGPRLQRDRTRCPCSPDNEGSASRPPQRGDWRWFRE